MSGNSKVIGVTMSRSGCEEHGAAATQLCDPWLQETRGATVHWSVCNHCVSHITSALFVWSMESRQPVVFVLSDCHRSERNAAY